MNLIEKSYLFKIYFLSFSVPWTLLSILVSFCNFNITAWMLQSKDHIAKTELSPSQNQNKNFHQDWKCILTFTLWTTSSFLIYSGSIVIMCLIGYIEMFSNYLTESGFRINVHLIPFLIILSNIPINIILYKLFINNKDSFSLAHAILSPVQPCR